MPSGLFVAAALASFGSCVAVEFILGRFGTTFFRTRIWWLRIVIECPVEKVAGIRRVPTHYPATIPMLKIIL